MVYDLPKQEGLKEVHISEIWEKIKYRWPMGNTSPKKENLREVPASEILDKIQTGEPVEYDHVIIKGNLDVSKLDLPIKHVARTEYQIKILGIPEDSKVISSSIKITDSKFDAEVTFKTILFESEVTFMTTFNGDVQFDGATFKGYADFRFSTFNKDAWFREATFSEEGADFEGAIFGTAYFIGATFKGIAYFDSAIFNEEVCFEGAKFEGDVLTFRDATFIRANSQEKACRRAKNVLAKAGNRDEEEYHFYREMEAKRIQKGIIGNIELGLGYFLAITEPWSFWKFFRYDVLEYIFIQKIFGYGVHPFRLFGWWLTFVLVFAIIYSIKGAIEQPDARQWYDYLWFSIATAATPGYALYKPVGMFKIIAGIEAILGTFMWAAFITTFARKFSR